MATVKKGKTLKLDAICEKLKSIGGDVPESINSDVLDNGVHSKLGQLCVKLHSFCEAEESGDPSVAEDYVSRPALDEKADTENNNHADDTETQNGVSESSDEVKDNAESTSSLTPQPASVSNNSSTISSQELVTPGSSRRKRRKAATPRNIAQVREILDQLDTLDNKDELAEYEINNQNTTFPPPDLDNRSEDSIEDKLDDGEKEEEADVKLSNSSHESSDVSIKSNSITTPTQIPPTKTKNSRKQKTPQIHPSSGASINMPLDLSMCRSDEICDEDNDDNDNEFYNDDNEDDDEMHYANEVQDLSMAEGDNLSSLNNSDSRFSSDDLQSSHTSTPLPKADMKSSQDNQEISVLKDYAENTMNELIQMYGFSGVPSMESLTGQVNHKNFTSNQILAHQGALQSKDKPRFILPKDDGQSRLMTSGQLSGLSDSVANSTTTQPKAGIYVNYDVNKIKQSNEGPCLIQKSDISQRPVVLVTQPPIQAEHTAGKNGDKFTNSAAYIKAVFNQQVKGTPNAQQGKAILPDYSKYLKRFTNGQDCQVKYCRDLGYREHFHCMDCNFRVFVKKEEMVRHFKWHRKREESLQHGFLRFSPMDDCSQKFDSCTHNGRQTHYHCLQGGCDKVYISTSDVQMHANYHRKDSAIIQEGFQRFRATEDCGTPSCAFYGQRTTHFHCRRPTCHFTFKNKADMEKHKTYHQKDEILGKDGFKKFMKYEHCGYGSCRYSKVSNHIHCIRPNCNYVLHSTAQLFSHKRKHERRDFENAYRKFRDDQSDKSDISPQGLGISPRLAAPGALLNSSQSPMSLPVSIKQEISEDSDSCNSSHFSENNNSMSLNLSVKREYEDLEDCESLDSKRFKEDLEVDEENIIADIKSESSESMNIEMSDQESLQDEKVQDKPQKLFMNDSKFNNLPMPKYSLQQHGVIVTSPQEAASALAHSSLPVKSSTSLSSSQIVTPALTSPQITTIPLPARPPIMDKKEKDESWKSYLIRYTANDPCNSRCQYLYKDHYHCKVEGCLVLFKSKDGVREHARFHELQDRITPVAYHVYEALQACPNSCQYSLKEKHYHCIWTGCTHVVPHVGPTFGRLEHYRIHEYARASQGKTYKSAHQKGDDLSPRRRGRPPKYPKINIPVIPKVELSEQEIADSTKKVAVGNNGLPRIINGFKMFQENEDCPDELCMYRMKQHYHCARPRCHHVTDRMDVLNLHAKDFHSFVNIIDGFEFFDRNVNCRRVHCHNNKANRHFHCVKPKCDYSFVRHSTMYQHDKKHQAISASKASVKTEVPVSTPGFVPIVPALSPTTTLDLSNKGTIKTTGTYYPLSGLAKSSAAQGTIDVNANQISSGGTVSVITNPLGTSSLAMVSPAVVTSLMSQPIINNIMNPVGVNTLVTPVNTIITQAGSISGSLVSQGSPTMPLTVLLQKGSNSLPQPTWSEMKKRMYITMDQNCCRPFCKLKKKAHYHCYECNLAFSEQARLRSHVNKHGIKFLDTEDIHGQLLGTSIVAPQLVSMATAGSDDDELGALDSAHLSDTEKEEDELNGSSSLNLEFSTFSSMIAKAQQAHSNKPLESSDLSDSLDCGKLVIAEEEPSNTENLDDVNDDSLDNNTAAADDVSNNRKSGRKRTATKRKDFVDSNSIAVKQKKTSSPRTSTSSIKDDSIPDGYIRVKQKEDCGYMKCAYRQGVTHFHCSRLDCGYSFSDRSRLIQHTLRHERIDSLTGGEMRQYRMNQLCERDLCEFQGKSSHFHCLKCEYSCTDSSKVLTHRKHHAKMESLSSQGFIKISVDKDCGIAVCQYNRKNMHYHCTHNDCNTAVLGPAQMTAHKLKHAI